MGRTPKIERKQLKALIDQGKNQSECARIIGVTPQAIYAAVRKFNFSIAKHVATRSTPALVKSKGKAIEKLFDLIEKCETQFHKVEAKLTPTPGKELTKEDLIEWQDQFLKFVGETRRLINTLADIRVKIYQVDKVERALMIIYEEVGRESAECQKRIADRLLRAGITFHVDG